MTYTSHLANIHATRPKIDFDRVSSEDYEAVRGPINVIANAINGDRVVVVLGSGPLEVDCAAIGNLTVGPHKRRRKSFRDRGGSEVAWAIRSGSCWTGCSKSNFCCSMAQNAIFRSATQRMDSLDVVTSPYTTHLRTLARERKLVNR